MPLTIFVKGSILDVRVGSEYAPGLLNNYSITKYYITNQHLGKWKKNQMLVLMDLDWEAFFTEKSHYRHGDI